MVQRKMMQNLEIYNLANALLDNFQNMDMTLPVKVNFYFQKNMTTIIEMAQELDKSRMAIFEKYGIRDDESGQYKFDPDDVEVVNKELTDLFTLEQEVKLNMLKLEWFDNVELSAQQVAAISFMIEDEDEGE